VTIGYYNNAGDEVIVYDYLALKNTPTRLSLVPFPNTLITKVFIRLNDNTPAPASDRYVILDYETFKVDGDTLSSPKSFLGGDALLDLKKRVFLSTPAPADSTEYEDLLKFGCMKQNLEYTIGYARLDVDSSLCGNAVYKPTITCFSLKGTYGHSAVALLSERVTISYQNLQGDFTTVSEISL
jgi:hypothetical protein